MTRLTLTRCGILLGLTVALWGLLAWPAWKVAGPAGLEGLTIATVLCSIPGLVVLFLVGESPPGSQRAAVMVLVGTGIRLAFVVAGALVVPALAPYLKWREFLVWLVILYLATLALETALVFRKPAQ